MKIIELIDDDSKSNVAVKWLALLLRIIWEVSGSNPGSEIGSIERGFS
jgi:hypothetical protein